MTVSPENWETVKTLFDAALKIDASERAAFLRAKSSNEKVRAEVERLLAEYDEAGTTFLPSPGLVGVPFQPNRHSRRFSDGEMLSGRFRILRFVAQGGMGEVYEAEDLELHERLAIKTLRLDTLEQSDALARFKREVHLARKVTHPNVCRIFDLYHHSLQGREEVVFVSMEFLRGETLAERLKRVGRLAMPEALPLIREMGSALDAAHKAGIVHRDFKPGNVVLVEEAVGTRAVVTDFGLAFRDAASSVDHSLSGVLWSTAQPGEEHHLYGTPAYMAPEQLEGHPATNASDIYALGLVIYEMVTGARPFKGDTPMSIALKRLVEVPLPPGKLEPSLSASCELVILKCLERDPDKRFAHVKDVVDALGEGVTWTEPGHGVGRLPRYRVLGFASLLAVLLIALALALNVAGLRDRVWHHVPAGSSRGKQDDGATQVRRSVAVFGFKNLAVKPEAAWLSPAISEMLSTEMAAGGILRIVPGEMVERAKTDLSLPDTDTLSSGTLSRLGKNLGADLVILGSYVALSGGKLRLDLRLQEVVSGEILLADAESGDEDNLFNLVSRAGAKLRAKCGIGSVSTDEIEEVRASLPSNSEATRLYAEGLSKLRSFDALSARDILQKAVIADPNYAMAHSALAEAWMALGYDEKARQNAKNAFELSSRLSREERLLIQARYREASKDWNDAVDSYRTLYGFFPDSLEYGILLARAQTRAGQGKEALTTIDSLRRLPPPMGLDPRIDVATAETSKALGDFGKQLAFAAKAGTTAASNGSRLLLARALYLQSFALWSMGKPKDATVANEKAKGIYAGTGDRNGLASTLEVQAGLLADQGNLSGAIDSYRQELSIVRDIGNMRAEASALNDLALIYSQQGNSESVEKTYQQALGIFREIGDKKNAALALVNIGGVLKDRGNLTEARATYEQALGISREINDKEGMADSQSGLATVLDEQGNFLAAKKSLEASIALDLQNGDGMGLSSSQASGPWRSLAASRRFGGRSEKLHGRFGTCQSVE